MKYTSTTGSEAFSDYKELEGKCSALFHRLTENQVNLAALVDSEHITREQLKEQENAALVQVSLIVFSFVFGYSIDAGKEMEALFSQRTNVNKFR